MNTTEAKARLDEELRGIEKALSELGPRNPQTGEWEATAGDIDTSATEEDEIADRVEEQEERQDEIDVLGTRRSEIMAALEAIEQGTYGVCIVCGATIEMERLEINPAARTCSTHA